MKLNEKIVYCRKKNGMSQDDLAAKIGVSRQAVSKWETGESEPEISKLQMLAKAFGVTADWMLSEDEPAEEAKKQAYSEPQNPSNNTNNNGDWLEHLPGLLGKWIRQYGWIAGVYFMICGAAVIAMGLLTKFSVEKMFSGISKQGFGAFVPNETSSVLAPMQFFTGFLFILGAVLMAIGLLCVIKLREKKQA